MSDKPQNEELPLKSHGLDESAYGSVASENAESTDFSTIITAVAKQILDLFLPVTVCIFLVVFFINFIPFYARNDVQPPYLPYSEKHVDAKNHAWQSVVNALIILGVIVVLTLLLVVLYKCRCYKVILAWLIITTIFVLFVSCGQLFLFLSKSLQVFADYVTFSLLLWNFAIVGILALFWKVPLYLQQAYLVVISAIMAINLIKVLPDWTIWFLLGLLSIWDLIAVLCPHGPLRILVETAQKRGDPFLPALVYSTKPEPQPCTENLEPSGGNCMEMEMEFEAEDEPVLVEPCENVRNSLKEIESREEGGIRLGLGDFVFYSVLVGKASESGNCIVITSTYVSVLAGLGCSLIFLLFFGRAVPALPCSICLGIITYITTAFTSALFWNFLAIRQIYI